MGKSWAPEIPAAYQPCVVVRVCRSAASPAACVGCAAELGAAHHPSCGWLVRNSHPCPPWPIQGLTWLIPTHTASPSMESQCLGSSAEQEHAWFSYFFSNNKSNHRFNAMDVLQNPLSEWFDKVWLSSFSGELPPVRLLLFCCSYKQSPRIFSRNAAPHLKCTGMSKPFHMS